MHLCSQGGDRFQSYWCRKPLSKCGKGQDTRRGPSPSLPEPPQLPLLTGFTQALLKATLWAVFPPWQPNVSTLAQTEPRPEHTAWPPDPTLPESPVSAQRGSAATEGREKPRGPNPSCPNSSEEAPNRSGGEAQRSTCPYPYPNPTPQWGLAQILLDTGSWQAGLDRTPSQPPAGRC